MRLDAYYLKLNILRHTLYLVGSYDDIYPEYSDI